MTGPLPCEGQQLCTAGSSAAASRSTATRALQQSRPSTRARRDYENPSARSHRPDRDHRLSVNLLWAVSRGHTPFQAVQALTAAA
jgi:hypothetical protein